VNILGFATDGTVPCPTVTTLNSVGAHISNPYLLGSSAGVSLNAGEVASVTVPVTANLVATNSISNCQGPQFGGSGSGGGGGGSPFAYKVVPQDNGSTFFIGTCVPMNLIITDTNGSNASVPATNSYIATMSSAAGATFYSDPGCATPLPSNQLIFNGYSTDNFYVKMPGSPTSEAVIVTPFSGTTTLVNAATGTLTVTSVANYTGAGVHLVDGRSLSTIKSTWSPPPLYSCYPYLMQLQDGNGMPITFNQTSSTATYDINSGSGLNFMLSAADSNCLGSFNGTTSPPSLANSSLTNAQLYGIIQSTTVSLTPYQAPSTVYGTVVTPTIPAPGSFSKLGIVSTNNNFLNPNGFSFTRPNTCGYVGEIGCFDASGNRSACGAWSGSSLQITGLSAGVLYADAACSTQDLSSVQSTVLNGATTRVPLYSKLTSTAGSYSISIVVTGSGAITTGPLSLTVQ